MKMYEVGGCVRDELLGIKSKDIDFSVVLEESDFPRKALVTDLPRPFDLMVFLLDGMDFHVYTNKKTGAIIGAEHFTATAKFPKDHPTYAGLSADFVLARKDGEYSDGRRPDSVEVGTLMDDLRRRDFTMNAIAKDEAGNFIDPFDGIADINDRVIRAVGTAYSRLTEDALRAVRALRFSVTKGFRVDHELALAMQHPHVLDRVENVVADERIAKELETMFRFDTVESIVALNKFPALTRAMFAGRVSLDSTLKTKGRGR